MNKELEVLETFIRQQNNRISELNQEILILQTNIDILERGLDEQDKLPVPPTARQAIIDKDAKIRKLEDDIHFYKKHVELEIIINRENSKKPVRNGGQLR